MRSGVAVDANSLTTAWLCLSKAAVIFLELHRVAVAILHLLSIELGNELSSWQEHVVQVSPLIGLCFSIDLSLAESVHATESAADNEGNWYRERQILMQHTDHVGRPIPH